MDNLEIDLSLFREIHKKYKTLTLVHAYVLWTDMYCSKNIRYDISGQSELLYLLEIILYMFSVTLLANTLRFID